MPVNRQKIRAFLSILTLNCQNNQPFRMEDVTRYVKVSSNAGTVLKKLGYISRGKDHGKAGHEWELSLYQKANGKTFEELVEEVASELDTYKATFAKSKDSNGGQLSIIPEDSLDLLSKQGCECTLNKQNIEGVKPIEKYAAAILENYPNSANTSEDLRMLILDIKDKVEKIYNHCFS